MTAQVEYSSSLGPAIADYLALKRALGRGCQAEAWVLSVLDRFLGQEGFLTEASFKSWCLSMASTSPNTRRSRMYIVRSLCLHIQRRDPGCFIPDSNLFPRLQQPGRPYIFSEGDILKLLKVASVLKPMPTSPLNAETHRIAIVLLYTAGLRRGELVRLTLSDFDPVERTLLIRASKFHKSRMVALSSDAARELEVYLVARRRISHGAEDPLLIWTSRGVHGRSGSGLGRALQRLFYRTCIRAQNGRVPRVHDLRHTHAVHALLRWYRDGVDVQTRLPSLATSMGHVSPVSTAHYLALLEPFAQAASERFADHVAAILSTLTNARGRGGK
jgi:integrase